MTRVNLRPITADAASLCPWTSPISASRVLETGPPTSTSRPAPSPMSASAARLVPLEDYPVLTPTDTREVIYSILTNDQRQRLETDWQLDFAYAIPNVARFRVNAYFQRAALGAAFRLIPFEIKSLDELGAPGRRPRARPQAARARARHRPDRLGQVDDAGRDDRRDQRDARRSTSSRSRTRSSSCTRTRSCIVNQREIGADAQSLRRGAEGRAAPGPRRDPRRRDARPGDDLDRADRRGDRPPRVRARCTRRTRRRRSTASSTSSRRPAAAGARAAVGRAPGRRHPELLPTADGAGRASPPARC